MKPIFAKSDCHFLGTKTVVSSLVASDCSGNERGVNIAKKTGYMKSRLAPTVSPEQLNKLLGVIRGSKWILCTIQSLLERRVNLKKGSLVMTKQIVYGYSSKPLAAQCINYPIDSMCIE